MSGFLLIDKPSGITSHKTIQIIRKKFSLNKIGHSGTLDPFATGLLIIGINEALKYISFIDDEPKVYRATLKLGTQTDTGDLEGNIVQNAAIPKWNQNVARVFESLKGAQNQIPPMYSAKKIDGQKLYKLARKGLLVDRKPQSITIYDLAPISSDENSLVFDAHVSKGTYIRALGEKIAEELGTLGHLTSLRRISAGPHHILKAKKPDQINLDTDFQSISSFLTHMQTIELDEKEAKDIMCGKQIIKNLGTHHLNNIALYHKDSFLGLGSYTDGTMTAKRMMSFMTQKNAS